MDRSAYRRQKGLEVFSPYLQAGLLPLARCEPDKNELDILNSYHVESELVFCHICGGRRHNNGFTGQSPTGELVLFGSKCAKSYFSPEALSSAEKIYKNKIALADAEFNVQVIKATAREIKAWLGRNGNMITNMADAWERLLDENRDSIDEVFEHLDKNNNRLTREYVEEASEISRSVGRVESTTKRQIVIAIGNETGRRRVRYIRDNYRLERFSSVLNL